MKHLVIFIWLQLFASAVFAQVTDNFLDGNFTANPTWSGDDSLFQVNGLFQLQSKGSTSKDISLSTVNTWAENCEWNFWVRNAFSPSTQNFTRFYLVSDTNILTAPLNGYYIQIGGITGNQDSLMLYRQNGLVRTWLAGGRPATVSKTNNILRIRVLHDNNGNWSIYSDTTGGYNYVLEASAVDQQITTSKYMGIFFRYTSGNANNCFLDDVYAGPVLIDSDPPQITQIDIVDSVRINLLFNEQIDHISATNTNHYQINAMIGKPISVSMLGSQSVQLTLANQLENRTNYQLTVQDVMDIKQNKMQVEQYAFTYFFAQYGDIVVSEFLPDPTPVIGLPEQEFIELYNHSTFPISLKDWTFSDASSSVKLPDIILPPDSFIILCHQSHVAFFNPFGKTAALSSFPALNNSSDAITIKDAKGRIIHQLNYDLTWYQDASKSDGGWSIEMINPFDLCKGQINFKASTHQDGGTPGRYNSTWLIAKDTTPPDVLDIWVELEKNILIQFTEVMDTHSLKQAVIHFSPSLNVDSLLIPQQSVDKLKIPTIQTMASNTDYLIDISQVKDCNQNTIIPVSKAFKRLVSDTAQQFDIVISEIMPKPDPIVGLPNAEYIELYNKSNRLISLQGWTIGDNNTTAQLPSFYLYPDSFIVITSVSNVPLFSQFANVFGVNNFPSLGNTEDQLVLKNNIGQVIHAIHYTNEWFQNNALKAAGGWSLEMVDANNPCKGINNWKPSTKILGGTPSKTNSVKSVNKDTHKPVLLQAYPNSHNQLRITFDEYMDSSSISNIDAYHVQDLGAANSVVVQPPFYNKAWVTFTDSIQPETIYKLSVDGARDCVGNTNDETVMASFGKPENPDSLDLIINEILFNPYTDGVDFVEVLNKSNKIIDFKNVWLANTHPDNSIKDLYPIADSGFLIFPNQYAIVTPMPSAVSRFYQVLYPELVIKAPLPTFANASGNCVLIDKMGKRFDQLDYDEKMHFELLDDKKGVSLERINPYLSTQDKNNWTSTSYTSGYATPTYKNSQFLSAIRSDVLLQVFPETFSPDQDGYHDQVGFSFKLPDNGYTANLFVYNSNGQLIAQLLRNQLLGTEGTIHWDGIASDNTLAPIGIYIVWMEVFNLKGDVQRVKKAFVLAGKL